MNNDLGTNYNNLSQAAISNAQNQLSRNSLINDRVNNLQDTYNMGLAQVSQAPTIPAKHVRVLGSGINHKHLHKRREVSSVGLNGRFVDTLPPAMMSQPFAQNFQFQHFLPPAYQKYSGGY
jgi:hypothetical protein